MNEIKQIKSFLTNLITPIVKDAVNEAMPKAIGVRDQNRIPVLQVTDRYGISQSKVYALFRSGALTKHKQGGLTFVDTIELEELMKSEKLTDKVPYKPSK